MRTSSASPADDFRATRLILRRGSQSFHAASLLLPRRIRGPVAAVYAFCRVGDDAVDQNSSPEQGLSEMRARLDAVYAGEPADRAVDRALTRVVADFDLPRAGFDALLEGFAWDVEGRRYATLAELRAYCVRVASSVGVIMTALMGDRRRKVLERAVDLGVAMQLTNIARDVGQDARGGRLYLPVAWLDEVGIDGEAFLVEPRFSPGVGLLTKRLLDVAEAHYRRADLGIRMLPRDVRLAVAAARAIYADIGREIVRAGYDSVSRRAFTTRPRKAWLLAAAVPRVLSGRRAPLDLPVVPEARDLVEAVSRG